MTKFVFIYRGGRPGATQEEQDKIMAAWGSWFEELGDALVDMGNPFGPLKAVTADGMHDKVDGKRVSGYSIVNAKDHDAAAKLAKGCPMLSYSSIGVVEVYEALPM
jgi:hypothetical protein